jgi:hypothetical protein
MSLLKVTTKAIGGLTFKVRPLPVIHGREAMVRLTRTFGPALGELVEGGVRNGAARAIGSLADRLDSKDLAWLCERFGECSSCAFPDGREMPIAGNHDEVFAAAYDTMFEWLEFCLEVNFRGFLEKLQRAVEAAKTEKAQASQSPMASIGKSGE